VSGGGSVLSAGARLLLAAGLAAVLGLATAPNAARAAAAPANATPEGLEDHFDRRWYYTEVIVFQRPAAMDHLTEEALVTPPRRLPRSLRAFATDGPLSARYPLYPQTHAYLAFPYLNQQLLAPWRSRGGLAERGSPAGVDRPLEQQDDFRSDAADAGREDAPGTPPPAIDPVLEPDPLLDFLAALADVEGDLAARSYRWLPDDSLTLNGMANRLRRSSGYRVLLHGRWLQPVPPRDAPEALLIEAGPPIDGRAPLQGSLDVTLGRYLHFNAHLYYTEPLLDRVPRDQALPPPGLEVAGAPALDAADLSSQGYMQLHQSRRLRSDEVHYLDHPKLGIIVKIEAVQPPESLNAAFEALEESAQ
jgi:hypothetical protein